MSEVLHRPETASATIASINPATEVELARFDLHSPAEIGGALTAAVKAQACRRRKARSKNMLGPVAVIKRSGYGRELVIHGIKEFVNIETVWIGPAQAESSLPRTKGD